MKKIAVLALATALAFVLAGCGSSSASSSSASSVEKPAASDVAEPSSSSASASSQSVETTSWNKAKTAADAAKGAGFDKFGVMDKIVVDDVEYTDPTFSYAGGVAQAVYEKDAIGITVRKADGKHDAPLTDRDMTEFAQKWAKSYEGLDVNLYGPAKGAATVITWSDGTQDFAVTYQGLGGEEVTLDSDDVAAIVKGLKEANAKEQPKQEEPKQEEPAAQPAQDEDDDESDEPSENNMTISQGDAEAAAEGLSGGWATGSYQDYVDGHGWVWVVMTNDENGNHNTYYVDDEGNPYNVDFDSNSSTELTLSEADACGVAADVSGGWATGAYQELTENHGLCWHVTTEDDNGNVCDYYVDNSGNAFNIDFE